MESKDAVTTLYQCSECDHCSQNLEEATLHAVKAHGEDKDSDDPGDSDEDCKSPKLKLKKVDDSDDEFAATSGSSLLYQQSNGLRKSELWPLETTKFLIQSVGENYHDLTSKLKKRKEFWEDIQKEVSKLSSDVTPEQCEQKWRNLISSQKKYISTKNSYGKSRCKKPDYFDTITEIVGNDTVMDKDPDFIVTSGKRAYKSARIKNRKFRDSNNISSSIKNMFGFEDSSDQIVIPTDNAALSRLVNILEKREASVCAFQREVLEIEREKLALIEKFLENKERYNVKRIQIIKDYVSSQKSKK